MEIRFGHFAMAAGGEGSNYSGENSLDNLRRFARLQVRLFGEAFGRCADLEYRASTIDRLREELRQADAQRAAELIPMYRAALDAPLPDIEGNTCGELEWQWTVTRGAQAQARWPPVHSAVLAALKTGL